MTIVSPKTGRTFEMTADQIEVTIASRADTSWRFTDPAGHLHRYFVDGQPAKSYRPDALYTVPTVKWVKDGEWYAEGDDQPSELGHYECADCGAVVQPRTCADTERVYVAGLKRCYIDGRSVTKDEFDQAVREELEANRS